MRQAAGFDDQARELSGKGVVGELAQLVVPGAAGLKAAKALSAANKLARTAKVLPLAADVAGSAAIGAVRLPGEDETRGENARSEASWALAGGVAEPILRTAVAGVKGTREAARLREGTYQPDSSSPSPVRKVTSSGSAPSAGAGTSGEAMWVTP